MQKLETNTSCKILSKCFDDSANPIILSLLASAQECPPRTPNGSRWHSPSLHCRSSWCQRLPLKPHRSRSSVRYGFWGIRCTLGCRRGMGGRLRQRQFSQQLAYVQLPIPTAASSGSDAMRTAVSPRPSWRHFDAVLGHSAIAQGCLPGAASMRRVRALLGAG
ncbi:hypothetical protein SS50377_22548 [Spironucleus salmonicida]|uniref:Uncharacterized protein n=1 Tax=Spironucleus salmonicida TaxID=348837 RepID=V6LBU0_9EUKA|nr:hypothetical protein SS50377_22548 [Spironucleus salmonicida]|eukprot:EST41960.1 Hypothetical protein SS50377_18265 [Spironucleus salmonicida]